MGLDIILGLILVAVVVVIFYLATHHTPAAAAPNAKDLATTLSAAASESWDAMKRDLPAIVSAEVAQLQATNVALLKRAQTAEADLAAEVQASAQRLEAVKAQVGSYIAGISGKSASSLVGPAVAAARAEDVAAVIAATASLSPQP